MSQLQPGSVIRDEYSVTKYRLGFHQLTSRIVKHCTAMVDEDETVDALITVSNPIAHFSDLMMAGFHEEQVCIIEQWFKFADMYDIAGEDQASTVYIYAEGEGDRGICFAEMGVTQGAYANAAVVEQDTVCALARIQSERGVKLASVIGDECHHGLPDT